MGIPAVALHLSRWCYDLLRVKSGADPHFFIREKDVLEKIAADATMKNLLSLNAAVAEMRRSAEHPHPARSGRACCSSTSGRSVARSERIVMKSASVRSA